MEWHLIFNDLETAHSKVTEKYPVTVVLNNQRICLGKHQGIFYAIEDTCPHQDASLGKGEKLTSGAIQCPFHHYTFDLKTGECLVGACRDLDTYKIKIEGQSLYILA